MWLYEKCPLLEIHIPKYLWVKYFKLHQKINRWNKYGGLVAKLCLTLATPWTIARQAPLSMGSSRQEYWSGLPFLFPETNIVKCWLLSLGDECFSGHLNTLFSLLCLKCFITEKRENAARSPLRQVTQTQAPSEVYEPQATLTSCSMSTSLKGQVMSAWLSIVFLSSR